jgi:hypothetical protein
LDADETLFLAGVEIAGPMLWFPKIYSPKIWRFLLSNNKQSGGGGRFFT